MWEGINGLPYLEAFIAGALVMFAAFRVILGREVFMNIFFGGEEDSKTKKEPTRNRASKA